MSFVIKKVNPFRQLSMFLNKSGPVWSTARSLTDRLRDEKISYAVIGGLAVYAHGYERTTNDVDILLARSDYEQFFSKFVGRSLKPRFQGAKKKFVDTNTRTHIDIILEGEYPGDGQPSAIAFPNPSTCQEEINGINVINLPRLIELKLASYQKIGLRRAQDLADVVKLIQKRRLNRSFAEFLHVDVRKTFLAIVEEIDENQEKSSNDDQ